MRSEKLKNSYSNFLEHNIILFDCMIKKCQKEAEQLMSNFSALYPQIFLYSNIAALTHPLKQPIQMHKNLKCSRLVH